MKLINLIICHCELRKFRRMVELAFMKKQGGIIFVVYLHLPIYFISVRKVEKTLEN